MTQQESIYRVTRIVWYILGAIEAVLLLRVVLRLFAANTGASFTQFVYSVSDVFVSPFRFVFGTPSAGGSALELSTILAMLVYWMIAWGIVKFVVMQRPVSQHEVSSELSEQDRA